MRVAIIQDWLNGMRGGEKVLEELCLLYPQAEIFTLFYEPERISSLINSKKIHVSVLQQFPGARKHYRNYLPLFPWAIARFDLSVFDLVISSSHCAAKGVCVPEAIPHVCYCHSPIRYIWDQYEAYFGGRNRWRPAGLLMPLLRGRLRRWDVATAARVGLFICNSHNVADKIREFYGRAAIVCNPPVDTEKFRVDPAGPDDYFLIVSALVPYKRVDLAIEVFNRLQKRLIVAGRGPEARRLKQLAGSTIEFHDWVSDAELVKLYARCRALIMPGAEDFGITPLEAMACGRPVIALGEGGALETVVAGQTGIFFHEPSAAALQQAVADFDPSDYDPQAVRKHAEQFGRERFRAELRAIIENYLRECGV